MTERDRPLGGRRILIVEDEFLIAEELREGLEELGAEVWGPVATVEAALAMLLGGRIPDGATLDITLGREKSFPVADALIERNVPFVFLTGYGDAALPERLRHVPRCGKPFTLGRIVQALSGAAGAGAPGRTGPVRQ